MARSQTQRLHPVARAFLRGLLIVVPAAVTAWLVWTVFVWIDGLFRIPVPGLGLLTALVVISGLGFLTGNVLARFFLDLLEQLPGNQQEVIRLKFQNGLSYREISGITGLSVSNVGVLIHYGLKAIRQKVCRAPV